MQYHHRSNMLFFEYSMGTWSTVRQCDKKGSNFTQGMEISQIYQGKPRKNKEKPRIPGSKFLIQYFLYIFLLY